MCFFRARQQFLGLPKMRALLKNSTRSSAVSSSMCVVVWGRMGRVPDVQA